MRQPLLSHASLPLSSYLSAPLSMPRSLTHPALPVRSSRSARHSAHLPTQSPIRLPAQSALPSRHHASSTSLNPLSSTLDPARSRRRHDVRPLDATPHFPLAPLDAMQARHRVLVLPDTPTHNRDLLRHTYHLGYSTPLTPIPPSSPRARVFSRAHTPAIGCTRCPAI